jgi:hypothetical protein
MVKRFVVVLFLLCALGGCKRLRELTTVEEDSFIRFVEEQDSESRLQAEYGTVLPPPRG